MKTLVIHPQDKSTDVLKIIYENKKDWTIINECNISNKKLKNLIYNHDRIIMMGHGSPDGLFNPGTGGFLIDLSFIDLLKEKQECVYIWCHADQFVKKYNLKNCFYTGMIISEEIEAMYCSVRYNNGEVESSNLLFAKSIRDHIDLSPKLLCENSIRDYNTNNNSKVMKYNRSKMYYL